MAGTAIDRVAAKQAHRLLRKRGKALTYVHTAETTFIDGTTAKADEQPEPTEYTAKGLIRAVRREWVDGTLVHATDKEILVARAALPVEPRQGGLVKVGGRTLTVADVRPKYSGELVWGFYLIVRA